MTALIELKNVTNQFGSQVVHDHVSLTLNENETLGLVGGSGSGKSVLLRTMLGLNRPRTGKVLVEGKDLYARPDQERLDIQKKWGVLFQNGALFSGLSVLDNVALPLREHTDLKPGAVEDLALLKLKMVGLKDEAADKRPSELSGGMITRAAVARAMALDPDILFLDEPTGALDPVAASALDELMQTLRDILKLSILIITHDPNTLVKVCDRIAMIVDKKIEAGTLDQMLKSKTPKVREYFHSPRVQTAIAERQ
jgi:phospholipid/cholesterol/gamma-HCH transport system ATP-binding protein